MIPTNVPPATTVASSRRSALSANASSSERGASHSGSVDNGDRLLVERPRELARAPDLDSLEHPLPLRLRPLLASPPACVPAGQHLRVHLEERERVRRLYEVLVRLPAHFMGHDQPLDVRDQFVAGPFIAKPVPDDLRRALRMEAPVLTLALRPHREILNRSAREMA